MVTFDGEYWYVNGRQRYRGPSTITIMDAAGDDEVPRDDAIRWARARFDRAAGVEEALTRLHRITVADLFYLSDGDEFIPRNQLPDGIGTQC